MWAFMYYSTFIKILIFVKLTKYNFTFLSQKLSSTIIVYYYKYIILCVYRSLVREGRGQKAQQ